MNEVIRIPPASAGLIAGGSHAVRVGDRVIVSPTNGRGADAKIPKDLEDQTRACLANVAAVLDQAGSALAQVVHLQVFLLSPATQELVQRVIAEVLAPTPPAVTQIGVQSFLDSGRIAIGAEAVVPHP